MADATAATPLVPGTSVAPQEAPIGKPVSGRTWKKVEKTRFSSVKYKGTKTLSTSWEEKMLKRSKLKELKALESEIKSRRQGERDAKRQAREEKEKRRKENELKSASVQVVRLCVGWRSLFTMVHGMSNVCVCVCVSFIVVVVDFAYAPHEDDEQEAIAQHQENNREQARCRRVRANLLQVRQRMNTHTNRKRFDKSSATGWQRCRHDAIMRAKGRLQVGMLQRFLSGLWRLDWSWRYVPGYFGSWRASLHLYINTVYRSAIEKVFGFCNMTIHRFSLLVWFVSFAWCVLQCESLPSSVSQPISNRKSKSSTV